MKNFVLVKLGGSLITDKTKLYTARMQVLRRIAREIHAAREAKEFPLVVGHGGGSFPHVPAHKYQTQKGVINNESWRGFSIVGDVAARLNRIVVKALIEGGENAVTVQPSACALAKRSKIVSWNIAPVKNMLANGLLPVPYGDVGLDLEQGCCILSTEEILGYLARQLGGKRILMLGEVDGVFTADPHKDPDAELIRKITPENFREVKKHLTGSRGIDVTGGMLHKVEQALSLARQGAESEIINGLKPGLLERALEGRRGCGTLITAK